MDGISSRVGVGNLDIAAGLQMLEGISVDGAQLQSERHPRALATDGMLGCEALWDIPLA